MEDRRQGAQPPVASPAAITLAMICIREQLEEIERKAMEMETTALESAA